MLVADANCREIALADLKRLSSKDKNEIVTIAAPFKKPLNSRVKGHSNNTSTKYILKLGND